MKIINSSLLLAALFLSAWGTTLAQIAAKPKLITPPAVVKGTIGGESHDAYVLHARRGQRLRVRISWKKDGDNRAEFTVSEGANFFRSEPVKFGREFNGGKYWTGRIPRTRRYHIYVVAHPLANYNMRVMLGK